MTTSGTDPTIDSPTPPPSSGASAPTALHGSVSPSAGTVTRFVAPSEQPGDDIGPYKLVKVLGEGGFGMVWLAEQRAPVQRRVALKLIKPGMDSGEVLTRFEAERQALALMDHPGIARVYDAGTTGKGRPFFAMEFIQGEPLHEYCDRARLNTADRLRLFVAVCHAVQHAHQKGIIHRDLKPSNILVAIVDNQPVPKIIDFGIAKALSGRLTEKTLFTETGRMMGTPEYMSPEQAGTTGLDVDTRTDVYSLGVVLYQLLVGALPFDPKSLRSRGYSEIMRIIKEDDPPRLSTRLSSLGDERTVIITRRRVDLRTLTEQLRGDLDWITARAMEKDRTRRYGMASDLAADVERYLAHQPVQARPPSPAYLARKFVRRHRVGVAAGSLIAGAVLLGAAGLAVGLVQATRARAEADRQRSAAVASAELATREGNKATAISAFLQNMLASIDPKTDNPRDTTVREVLDQAAGTLPGKLRDQPAVEGAVRNVLGRTYMNLGEIDSAEPQLRAALAIRQKESGDNGPDAAETKNELARALTYAGKYDDAIPLYKEALAEASGRTPPDPVLVALRRKDYAVALAERGDSDEAQREVEACLATLRRPPSAGGGGLGDDSPEVLDALAMLAAIKQQRGDLAGSEASLRELLPLTERASGPEHRDTGRVLFNLGELLRQQAKGTEAEPVLRRAVAVLQMAVGPLHPNTASALTNLGLTRYELGDLDEAERLLRQALAAQRHNTGSGDGIVDIGLLNLAGILNERAGPGARDEAAALAREAIALAAKRLPPGHPQNGFPLLLLGRILTAQGAHDEGERTLRQALSIFESALKPEDANLAVARAALGQSLALQGKADEALKLLESAWPRLLAGKGPAHPRTRDAAAALATLYRARGENSRAAEVEAALARPVP